MGEHSDDFTIARLSNGQRLVSVLLTDESPPRHVYRVLVPDGTVLSEHETLNELIDRVDDEAESE